MTPPGDRRGFLLDPVMFRAVRRTDLDVPHAALAVHGIGPVS
jgi:hypothetical protein